jgi:hypothetical protein
MNVALSRFAEDQVVAGFLSRHWLSTTAIVFHRQYPRDGEAATAFGRWLQAGSAPSLGETHQGYVQLWESLLPFD